jgi:Uncharacterized protein conserved in bacteria
MPTESYSINDQLFTWDKNKNLSNIKKHGVPFKEAATVFLDPSATLIDDEDHSQDEERYIVIGMSKKLRMLMVCHCYRDDGETIRIVSAREATSTEENLYGGAI